MSRNGTLLPIPEGSDLAAEIERFMEGWPADFAGVAFPRSAWLGYVENTLRIAYPQSSSADRKLTARHYAPFPLRDGPNVP